MRSRGGLAAVALVGAEHGRWLLLYSAPLSKEVTVRSALGVSGPWSLPVTLGRCDLPTIDPGSFCSDVTLVPSLAARDALALTQGVGSLARAPAASATDYATRLIRVLWPSALP